MGRVAWKPLCISVRCLPWHGAVCSSRFTLRNSAVWLLLETVSPCAVSLMPCRSSRAGGPLESESNVWFYYLVGTASEGADPPAWQDVAFSIWGRLSNSQVRNRHFLLPSDWPFGDSGEGGEKKPNGSFVVSTTERYWVTLIMWGSARRKLFPGIPCLGIVNLINFNV